MRRKKLFAALCTVVYLIVFAHSVVPHDHHIFCFGEDTESEAHHPHHGSCEMLDIFTVSDALSDEEILFCLGEILPSEPLELPTLQPAASIFHHSVEDEELSDTPPVPASGLRAPPVA